MRPMVLCLALFAACAGEPVQTQEDLAAEKCPKVHSDRFEGRWLLVSGTKGDATTRLQVFPEGDGYKAWFVTGSKKVALKGEKVKGEVRFTEVPTDKKKERVATAGEKLVRAYFRPDFKTCIWKAQVGTLDKNEHEKVPPPAAAQTFAEMPADAGEYTFRPADEVLFIGDAAKSRKVAEKELEELGAPKYDFDGNPIPMGLFTTAASDGADSCTFDMDLYVDGQPAEGNLTRIPAGKVADGFRHWFHELDYDYGGNVGLEIYRYRTCGAARELIAVAALEVVL